MEFCAEVRRDQDGRKRIMFALIILQKRWYCECTQINVESLSIWKMYYSYQNEQTWQSILGVSERTGAFICPAVITTVQLPHSAQTLSRTFL